MQQPSTLFVFNAILLMLIAFAILPIFLSLERIPQSLPRASGDPVAGLQAFRRITLPLGAPGAASVRLSTVFLTATTLVAVLRYNPLFGLIASTEPVGRDGRRRHPGLSPVVR